MREFPGSSARKESACNARDPSSIPGSERYALEKNKLPTPVFLGFPGGSVGKASAYNVGELGSIPGSGRSPREGNGNPLQYSYLENPMDGGTWLGYSPWGHKELDTTEQLNNNNNNYLIKGFISRIVTFRGIGN